MIESVDIEDSQALLAYLFASGRIEAQEHPAVDNLAGGVSCRTVRVTRESGETWVLKQALPQLRVAVEWQSDPKRIRSEGLAMKWLGQILPRGAIPSLVFEDEQNGLVAMTAVAMPHETLKARLMRGAFETAVPEAATILAAIHSGALSFEADLRNVFADQSAFESLRVDPFYGFSRSVSGTEEFLGDLMRDCRTIRVSLVHGDFSPKNILIHDEQLVLVDHEVIHWGDSAFDIGFFMAHLLSKAHHFVQWRSAFLGGVQSFWDRYDDESDYLFRQPDYEARAVRHTIGCLLARVKGKSPLEYLDARERVRQTLVARSLMGDDPATFEELVTRFDNRLAEFEQ
ncbi:MAG: phosphotransferase [Acidimicrobiia bacterium]